MSSALQDLKNHDEFYLLVWGSQGLTGDMVGLGGGGGGEASVIFASLFCDAEDGTQSLMYARHDCH